MHYRAQSSGTPSNLREMRHVGRLERIVLEARSNEGWDWKYRSVRFDQHYPYYRVDLIRSTPMPVLSKTLLSASLGSMQIRLHYAFREALWISWSL